MTPAVGEGTVPAPVHAVLGVTNNRYNWILVVHVLVCYTLNIFYGNVIDALEDFAYWNTAALEDNLATSFFENTTEITFVYAEVRYLKEVLCVNEGFFSYLEAKAVHAAYSFPNHIVGGVVTAAHKRYTKEGGVRVCVAEWAYRVCELFVCNCLAEGRCCVAVCTVHAVVVTEEGLDNVDNKAVTVRGGWTFETDCGVEGVKIWAVKSNFRTYVAGSWYFSLWSALEFTEKLGCLVNYLVVVYVTDYYKSHGVWMVVVFTVLYHIVAVDLADGVECTKNWLSQRRSLVCSFMKVFKEYVVYISVYLVPFIYNYTAFALNLCWVEFAVKDHVANDVNGISYVFLEAVCVVSGVFTASVCVKECSLSFKVVF